MEPELYFLGNHSQNQELARPLVNNNHMAISWALSVLGEWEHLTQTTELDLLREGYGKER
jgi:hypothetical protein